MGFLAPPLIRGKKQEAGGKKGLQRVGCYYPLWLLLQQQRVKAFGFCCCNGDL